MRTYKSHKICEMLGIGKSTLFRWEKENKIPNVIRKLNGDREYTVGDIKTLLKNLNPIQRKRLQKNIENYVARQSSKILEIVEEIKSLTQLTNNP